MTNLTDERIEALLAQWENNSLASASHDLDTTFADEHAAAFRELLARRTVEEGLVEALKKGAHWTSERGRFSSELADSIEKKMATICEPQITDVAQYVNGLRKEAETHNAHAALLRRYAATLRQEGKE